MTLVAIELEEAPTRAFVPAYTAIVIDEAAVVLDHSYDTPSARRDAVVELLGANHDEVPTEDVEAILIPFGGANADVALAQVVGLYADYGVDVHLGEYLCDVGPLVLYSSFTDYGDGTTFVAHYASRDERLAELRQRAADFSEDYPMEFFDKADEETCKRLIEFALTPTRGHLHLFDAKRRDVGDSYVSEG